MGTGVTNCKPLNSASGLAGGGGGTGGGGGGGAAGGGGGGGAGGGSVISCGERASGCSSKVTSNVEAGSGGRPPSGGVTGDARMAIPSNRGAGLGVDTAAGATARPSNNEAPGLTAAEGGAALAGGGDSSPAPGESIMPSNSDPGVPTGAGVGVLTGVATVAAPEKRA